MEKPKEYTPEEVKEIKERMLKKWESEIPFLQKQVEYETLITTLEELQFRRVFAQVKVGDMLAQQPKEEDPEIVPKHERKLKKEPV